MHSSDLRGTDFRMALNGRQTPHAEVFQGFSIPRRVGVVCPEPLDGLGAATLLLAAVTAFYDGYRDMGSEFFAYPDFFTLQLQPPVASYSMFDIWPDHKNVSIADLPAGSLVDAITDRGIDTLLLPDDWSGGGKLEPVQQAALQRTLRFGYAYSPSGDVEGADLSIACEREPLASWAARVVTSVTENSGPDWHGASGDDRIEQSFRRLSTETTLSRL